MSGDVTLTADITFFGKGVNEHRKAVLMIRQSLDADSPYAVRGIAWQRIDFAAIPRGEGAATHEIQANVSAPKRLRIEKARRVLFHVARDEKGEFRLASGSTRSH